MVHLANLAPHSNSIPQANNTIKQIGDLVTVNSTELVILLHAVLKGAEHLEGSITLNFMDLNII